MTEEQLRKQRERRKRTGNATTKKYEKSPKGFLMRLYRNMQSRVTGVQKQKFHLYQGKELLDRQDFYNWSIDNPIFLEMFEIYKSSEFNRKLAPTVDRIDSSKGYSLDNMRWLTHSENSRLGSISAKNKKK
jgi:hypothetical protein